MNKKLETLCKKIQYLICNDKIVSVVLPRTYFALTLDEKEQVTDYIAEIVFSPRTQYMPEEL